MISLFAIMNKYMIKRIASLVPVLFLVSIGIFLLIHLTPGDPARAMLGDTATEAEVQALRDKMGLNAPLALQYIRWVGDIFHGDLGDSLFINEPMSQILLSHLGPTVSLTIYAMLIAVVLAVPFGILAAAKRKSMIDAAASVFALGGISIPSFLMGLFFIMLIAVRLKWLPSAGYKTIEEAGFLTHLKYLTLPAAALGFQQAALITRMTKTAMLEVLGSDYIRMARAKGVRELVITVKHALRNALIPIITVVGHSFISLLSGAAVVETVFNIPGIGQLIVNSVSRRDYEVIQAVVLVIALLNVLVNLAVDILYGLANPKIDLE